MTRFRTKLTLVIISLISISVITAGIYMANSFKNNYIEQLEQNMSREMLLIEQILPWEKISSLHEEYAFYSEWAKKLDKSTHSRVTFIKSDGTVVGDSLSDVRKMDNHLLREEVKLAESNAFGSSIRYSNTLDENMLYVALPVKHAPEFDGFIRLAMSLKTVDDGVKELWAYLGLGLFILILIAAIISSRIAYSLTKPIENMTRVAKRITHMDYQARTTTVGSDEIGQLGAAINAMADSLQVQMTQIREQQNRLQSVLEHMMNGIIMVDEQGQVVLTNKKAEELLGIKSKAVIGQSLSETRIPFELIEMVHETLDKRNLLHDELTIYYPEERLLDVNVVPVYFTDQEWAGVLLLMQDMSKIRQLERMRSEFVANVSHELKTPIAAVKGFTETLMNGAMNDTEIAQSFLKIIHDESERLNRLIGDILQLSKIEAKRVPLLFSPVFMPSFMEDTVNMLRKEAEKKHIDIFMTVEEDMYIEADEDRLRQIVLNLLSNAINYTPDGGRVNITAAPLEVNDAGDYDQVRIRISDTGIGIPKKDLPRIFERFYRVDKARSRSSGGTGLGLSIVKHLIESHHGTIQVESTVGVGTTFTIELPVIQEG
ncbi:two-component system histidine kinase PnpS [Paenibacillus sp. 1001270B_150601_E10]|uniref:two-component system histidine kinase PnpS n=1 Tax=Paenibacillus sp. 1001270B_150601_E10 TaxID=2787079 RepID=UPI00189E378F|nr:ATP-binding protein [Paenibacillus sp. 1001270B_150601_E10]